jgi:hypothetical protein
MSRTVQPVQSVGARPLGLVEVVDEGEQAAELRLGQRHGLVVVERRDRGHRGHGVLLAGVDMRDG